MLAKQCVVRVSNQLGPAIIGARNEVTGHELGRH